MGWIKSNRVQALFAIQNWAVGLGKIIFFAMFLISCAKEKPVQANPVYGVVFGDSIAYGKGVKQDQNRLSNCLQTKSGQEYENLGVNGETSQAALNRVSIFEEIRPKVIIISLGGNDILRFLNQLKDRIFNLKLTELFDQDLFTPDRTYQNMQHIYQKAKETDATVIHLGISPPLTFKNLKSFVRDQRLENLEYIAHDNGVYFMPDVLKGLWLNPEYMADDFHPNDTGNQIVCNRIYNFLQSITSR